MLTKILKVGPKQTYRRLNQAAQVLRDGGLVAFPTETVYGLGAAYNNESALLRIFAVKGRPADNPVIVHLASSAQLPEVARELTPAALRLTEVFWPGPLTLVLPKQPGVSTVITAGLDTVAVRLPAHPVARKLVELAGVPIAAPSANLSGRPSPTRGSHVIDDLNGKIELIVDAGATTAGIESTVLTLERGEPCILRPGSITQEMLAEVLQQPVRLANPAEYDHPLSPGTKYRHYAPLAPVLIFEGPPEKVIIAINQRLGAGSLLKPAVLASTENLGFYQTEFVLDLGPRGEPEVAAQRLFELLRFCDRLKVDQILIEGVAPSGVGLAVADRLNKAAGGNVIHVS